MPAHVLPYINGLNFAFAAARLLSTSHAMWDTELGALRAEPRPGAHAALVVSTLGAVARSVLIAGSSGRLFWPSGRGCLLLNGVALGVPSALQLVATPEEQIPQESYVQLSPEKSLAVAGLLVLLALGFGPSTRCWVANLTSTALSARGRKGEHLMPGVA